MPTARTRLASVAGLAAAAAAFLSWYGNRHDFFDLRIYVSAMRWWADGNPLYDYVQPDRVQGRLYFTYPPFTAMLMRPLAGVPVGVTVAVLTTATVLATIVTTWWLVAPVADRHGWPRWYAAGLAVPLVFATEPSRETITLGQINMLLVVLILADLLLGVPRGSRLAGAGVGLATALKLYPGIFVAYLLVTRRWRAAALAAATAAAATLLAAAVAPGASWQFWTRDLWETDRVGRTDYTGNQSLLGLISRLVAPDEPSRLLWLPIAAAVAAYGLWRAARAAAAGDELTGIALTGLAGALASPITWPHHIYWFVPALVALVDHAARGGGAGRLAHAVMAFAGYAVTVFGVVSFTDYGVAALRTDDPGDFVVRNLFVLLALVFVGTLPEREPALGPAGAGQRQGAEHQPGQAGDQPSGG
jgi:alpha-1,2-mannosyltransferase